MRGLSYCPGCGGESRLPVDWTERGMGFWWVLIRCPDCGERTEGTYRKATVEAFDLVLDRQQAQIRETLERLTHANMSEDLVQLEKALAANALFPEDFR